MTRRIAVFLLAIFLPVLATGLPAVAHDSTPPPHGGVAADAGPYYCELVVGGGAAKLYVYDDESMKPVALKGAKVTATVLVGQERENVTFQLDESEKDGNLMSGKLGLKTGTGTRIVVQIQIPGKQTVSARYAL